MFSIRSVVNEWQQQYRLRKASRDRENRVHRFTIDGIELVIRDQYQSLAAHYIASEMQRNCYTLDTICFSPGDIVIDIGAHVGIFACYLAKRFPFLTIYAFEPVPRNFSNLLLNIGENRVSGVHPFNEAVSGDGRRISLEVSDRNSGGASAFDVNANEQKTAVVTVPSQTLDSIFEKFSIKRCKLLKIDCEGAEYEILTNSAMLGKIDCLRGEFHESRYLENLGCSPEKLIDYCGKFIDRNKIGVEIFNSSLNA
jgi:FkbM family methyltransferase